MPGNHCVRRAFLVAIYEYCLVVFPVAIYSGLEAFHDTDTYFVRTPEWAVATIFLLFQGLSLYGKFLRRTGRRVSENFFGLAAILSLVLVIIAVLNASESLGRKNDSETLVVWRILLFAAASATFITLVAAGKFTEIKRAQHGS
jgi:hypothetical protein